MILYVFYGGMFRRLLHLCGMNLNLQGKTALVCGSTQGIGRAAAMELASMGAAVVLLARNEESLKETLQSLPGAGHSYLVADFAHAAEVQKVILSFAEKHTAHILVNNTGGPPPGKISDAEIEAFRVAFNSHLINNHILATALIPGMKAAGFGRIINVISTSVKQPLPGLGVSNTIRAAVANWSKTLATEVAAYGITVNNVLPGATETGRLKQIIHGKAEKGGKAEEDVRHEMEAEIPAGRLGKPEEIAAAIAFLASPAAGYINGINVPVDGGRTLCL
jgi:3-oxoacyl-[acyl-carrier protein] reductase